MNFDLPYPSVRTPILARQAVATSHPLAAQAGLLALEAGGSAVDAAVAAAATLTVVEPTMNGLGGDLFAIVSEGASLHGLNASGRAPLAWTPARFSHYRTMPALGWDAVTVPGLVSGWVALWDRFGKLPFERLLEPAIRYAATGYPVMPKIAALWAQAESRFAEFPAFGRTFLPDGRAPRAGEWFRSPALAASLTSVAETRGESFYRGDIAGKIAAAAAQEGGAMTLEDLDAHRAEWVDPIDIQYQGVRVHELPPNGQGLATLIALGILTALEAPVRGPDHPETLHAQIEAMKLAFAECAKHLGDPGTMRLAPSSLLAPSHLAELASRIRLDRAQPMLRKPKRDHGTVYVAAADRAGNMVSLIQSNYLGFGAGVVIPETGISMHNRGLGFSLDPTSPCHVGPGARPYHTIMPGFVSRGGEPMMAFGVMGGHMQPQGHVQILSRMFQYGQNAQAACDAPRWFVSPEGLIGLEPGMPPEVRSRLAQLGHDFLPHVDTTLFGGAQVIVRGIEGYCAASDPRKDGQAVGS
jgi:gamma-glutamyltranspeptidase/glutathione hydrolase